MKVIKYEVAKKEALDMLEWNDVIEWELEEFPNKPISQIKAEWVEQYIWALQDDGYKIV